MANTYSIVGVTDNGSGTQTQSLITNGTNGQLFYATTGQLAAFGIPTVASVFGTSAAPTGTTSTAAYVMLGLGGTWTITPTTYTKIRVTINGQCKNGTSGDGINFIIAYNSGSAPANGDAVTGTTVGLNTICTDLSGLLTNGFPFCKDVIITALVPGTAYWIDLQFKATFGGTAAFLNLEFSAQELMS